jgi:hypothetical protein
VCNISATLVLQWCQNDGKHAFSKGRASIVFLLPLPNVSLPGSGSSFFQTIGSCSVIKDIDRHRLLTKSSLDEA